MRGQSRDELEWIAKIRRIKNFEEMSKEELIIYLLKSKQSISELFNNNLDDDKISDIRRILNRLRDTLPKRYRKEIKKRLYEIENNEDLPEAKKEENDEYLWKLVRNLDNKEKYSPHDHHDFDYYGIRDKIYFMSLVKKTIINQYQEKVLLRVITNMKAEGIKKKDYQ